MQTNLASPLDTVTVSFIYVVRYGYSDTVIHNDNLIRIFPREGEGQSELESEVWSIPSGRGVDFKDRFGNQVRRFRVVEPHTNFTVAATGNLQISTLPPAAEEVSTEELRGLPETFEYTNLSPLVDPDSVSGAAANICSEGGGLLATVEEVNQWVFQNVLYTRGTTSVATTAEQVMKAGEGVCQDKTHLSLGLLRSLKIPCRYASGLITGQTGETHSWVEFFHPASGWLAADPTRGVMLPPPSDYVKFGVGRDYTDVSPVVGSFLSTGGAVDIAAIADVRFGYSQFSLADALSLLEDAYVIGNEAGSPSYPPAGRKGTDDPA
jgi:transglutaminase-like putative cysteine protease